MNDKPDVSCRIFDHAEGLQSLGIAARDRAWFRDAIVRRGALAALLVFACQPAVFAQGTTANQWTLSAEGGIGSIGFNCGRGCANILTWFHDGMTSVAMGGGNVRLTRSIARTVSVGAELSGWYRPTFEVRCGYSGPPGCDADSLGLSKFAAMAVAEWRPYRSLIVALGAGPDLLRVREYNPPDLVIGTSQQSSAPASAASTRGSWRDYDEPIHHNLFGFAYHGSVGYEIAIGPDVMVRPALGYGGGVRRISFNPKRGVAEDRSLRLTIGLVRR